MIRLSHSKFYDMLVLQARLNAVVDPLWITRNFPWTRAIRVECAELTEHLGYKWWKKEETNWEQARLELVDIWHFMLSATLVSEGTPTRAATALIGSLENAPSMEIIDVLGHKFTFNGLNLHECVDKLSMFASCGFVMPPLFEKLMQLCGLEWDELYRQYVAKNVLNLFRQVHGYKDGTYRKIWGGREDNVVLMELYTQRPNATPELLTNLLEEEYGRHQGS